MEHEHLGHQAGNDGDRAGGCADEAGAAVRVIRGSLEVVAD